jgi:hypothetical protein
MFSGAFDTMQHSASTPNAQAGPAGPVVDPALSGEHLISSLANIQALNHQYYMKVL